MYKEKLAEVNISVLLQGSKSYLKHMLFIPAGNSSVSIIVHFKLITFFKLIIISWLRTYATSVKKKRVTTISFVASRWRH